MVVMRLPSPAGALTLSSDGEAITGLWMEGQKYAPDLATVESRTGLPVFREAEAWLDAYFRKAPLPPMPPLLPEGTPFRLAVWDLLRQIPYGETTTYGAIARTLRERGIAASPQAVGGAVGRNPIAILIPCHRVIGSTGSLTGYAAGLEVKAYLLRLEQAGKGNPPSA